MLRRAHPARVAVGVDVIDVVVPHVGMPVEVRVAARPDAVGVFVRMRIDVRRSAVGV